MKKIFTLIAASFLAVTSFAQTDLAVDAINYDTGANGEYLYGAAGPFSIVWSNQGSDINAGDTVFAFVSINGALFTAPGFIASAPITAGTVDTINYHATTNDPNSFATRLSNLSLIASSTLTIGGNPVGPNRELSAYMQVFRTNGNGNADADVDNTNDTASVAYTLEEGDFSATNLSVVAPANVVNANNEIELGNTIDTVSFDFRNNSDVDFFHYLTTFERSVNGNLDTVSLVLPRGANAYGAFTGFVEGGNSITVTMSVDPASLPTTVGDFDVCVRSIYADDADDSNNEVCVTYTYVNPTGIESIEDASIKTYFANNMLNISVENTNEILDVAVTNVNGQVVYTGKAVNGLNTIDIQGAAGVYMVTVGSYTEKVVKF